MNPASPPPDKDGQPCPIRVEYMQKGYGCDIRDNLELNILNTACDYYKIKVSEMYSKRPPIHISTDKGLSPQETALIHSIYPECS